MRANFVIRPGFLAAVTAYRPAAPCKHAARRQQRTSSKIHQTTGHLTGACLYNDDYIEYRLNSGGGGGEEDWDAIDSKLPSAASILVRLSRNFGGLN